MNARNWSALFGMLIALGVLTACACQTNVPTKDIPDTEPIFEPQDDDASTELTPIEPVEEEQPSEPVVELVSVFYFDLDDATLPPDTFSALRAHAERLKSDSELRIVIEGHCDERGTREYNLALGDRRAEALENFLLSAGVSPSQIETVSFGEEKPVTTESNEAAWALNRRAEIKYQ